MCDCFLYIICFQHKNNLLRVKFLINFLQARNFLSTSSSFLAVRIMAFCRGTKTREYNFISRPSFLGATLICPLQLTHLPRVFLAHTSLIISAHTLFNNTLQIARRFFLRIMFRLPGCQPKLYAYNLLAS